MRLFEEDIILDDDVIVHMSVFIKSKYSIFMTILAGIAIFVSVP